MNFNLGLIGAGKIAQAHVAAVEALAGAYRGVRITAVVDPMEAARSALAAATGAQGYADFATMLRQCPLEDQPDAVVVCTPPSVRVELVGQALAAGMPVLIEKPPAQSVSHVQQLIALSDASPKLACLVGFCHRFTPAVDEMVRRVNDGLIGEVVRFENTFAANLPHLRDAWMSDPAVSGGGSLIDTGLHSLDLFGFLFGHARVEGAVFRHGWADRGESNATLLLSSTSADGQIQTPEPAGGVAGIISCGWAESTRFEVALVGTTGTLAYDFEDARVLRHTAADGRRDDLAVETHEVRFTRQLEAFIDRCRAGQTTKPVCNVTDSLEAMQLVADAASRDGRRAADLAAEQLEPQIVQRHPAAPASGPAHIAASPAASLGSALPLSAVRR